MLKIIAVDSGCSELNRDLQPTNIIATAAVYLEYPYRFPKYILCNSEPFHLDSSQYVLRELSLAYELSKKYKPDQIHIDVTLNGIEITNLNRDYILTKARISNKGRQHLLEVIDQILELGRKIKDDIGCEILFLGKDSWAVRIAELSTAICALEYAIRKLRSSDNLSFMLIGLPKKTKIDISNGYILAKSEFENEKDFAVASKTSIPSNFMIGQFPNPTAMGFRVIKIRKR